MKLKKVGKITIVLLLWVVGCRAGRQRTFEKKYYQKSTRQWVKAMRIIGFPKRKLRNQVVLVMHATECPVCLQELAWWNERGRKQVNARVSLVVIEKYRSSFQAFLKNEQVQLTAYRDSAGLLFGEQLIPTEPIKIYFNKNGKVALIYQMGGHARIYDFVKRIKDDAGEVCTTAI